MNIYLRSEMGSVTLKSKDLIDPESEIHYAFHKSLHEITLIHRHDFYEIFLILKGQALHNINGEQRILKPGTLVFVRPDDKHNYEKQGEFNCELINIAFPASTVMKLFDYLGEGFRTERLLNAKHPPEIILPELETDILKFRFESLNTISRSEKVKIKTELRILLAEIFVRYFPPDKDIPSAEYPMWLSSLLLEMKKKENFSMGFERMLELSGRSRAHLSRSFKKYTGETATEYLNNLRLNYAANLISNSDEDISLIAYDAGFSNLSYFYRIFRKQFKSAPKEFRQKHQRLLIPLGE